MRTSESEHEKMLPLFVEADKAVIRKVEVSKINSKILKKRNPPTFRTYGGTNKFDKSVQNSVRSSAVDPDPH
jgi:hypothetical protein